jgi:hypothetical protein
MEPSKQSRKKQNKRRATKLALAALALAMTGASTGSRALGQCTDPGCWSSSCNYIGQACNADGYDCGTGPCGDNLCCCAWYQCDDGSLCTFYGCNCTSCV